MPSFIALDFGTTNCLAAEVTNELTLRVVKLDKKSDEMPSAIFLSQSAHASITFDETNVNEKVAEILREQEIDRERLFAYIRKRLQDFWNIYRPRIKEPGRTYSTLEQRTFNFVKSSELDAAIELFKQTKYQAEKEKLLEGVPRKKTETEVRSYVEYELLKKHLKLANDALKEQTFFTALDSQDFKPLFGSEAIDAYASSPQSGFFMRSPKAFLGVSLSVAQKELFIKVVTLIIKNIKSKSEDFLAKRFNGVVIGRPINFMGANTPDLNKQAEDILRTAAIRAGFDLIRFVHEPLAAALTISNTFFSSDSPALVIDIGGGTTDVAFLNINLDSQEKLSIEGIAGQRTGGNDFDEKIALRKFSSHLGYEHIQARRLLTDALATRDIHRQAKFRNSGDELIRLIQEKQDSEGLNRLHQLYSLQLQHQVIITAESLKIGLGQHRNAKTGVKFLKPEFEVEISDEEFSEICEREFKSIYEIVDAAIPGGYKNIPLRVFITGGMSGSHTVIAFLEENLPRGSSIRRLPPLRSIAAGLAIVARQLNLSESITSLPASVRGIPITE